MASVTLCADNIDVSDQVFTVDVPDRHLDIFVGLVKNGWKAVGITKPSLIIKTEKGEQILSDRNNWLVDSSLVG